MAARGVRKQTDSTEVKQGWNWLRVAGLWLLATVACLAFAGYVVVRWVERQILNTDNWVALVTPLPKQQVVSDALGAHIANQVVDTKNIQTRIEGALPEQAAFLAGPLSGQVSALATRTAQGIVASDAFQSIWSGANRIAMGRLLATARGETPPLQARVNQKFNIDISQTGGQLRAALGKTGEAIPALQPASQKALAVSADLKSRPRRLQQVVQKTDYLYAVLPMTITAAYLGAMALARRRRLATMAIATASIVLVLLEIIGVNWLRGFTLDQVRRAENLSAVSYIYDTIIAGLRDRLFVALAVLVGVLIICWLAGPSRWAAKMRHALRLDRIRSSRIGSGVGIARRIVGRWKYYIWLAIVVLVLAAIAITETVTTETIANAGLLIISLLAATQLFAARAERAAA